MEFGAEGANSGKRVSQWLTCRFERVERGWKFRAPTARVAFGTGEEGGFKGTDEDEQEEDGEQDGSCPTKLSGEPGVEICRSSWI